MVFLTLIRIKYEGLVLDIILIGETCEYQFVVSVHVVFPFLITSVFLLSQQRFFLFHFSNVCSHIAIYLLQHKDEVADIF